MEDLHSELNHLIRKKQTFWAGEVAVKHPDYAVSRPLFEMTAVVAASDFVNRQSHRGSCTHSDQLYPAWDYGRSLAYNLVSVTLLINL